MSRAKPAKRSNKRLAHLLYYSRHNNQASFDLEQLLVSSRANNETMDITGALLFTGFHFVQFLEGPYDAISEVFHHKITPDARHYDVTLLLQAHTPERLYSDWAMKFFGTDDAENDPLFEHFRPNTPELSDLDSPSLTGMLNFLRAFGKGAAKQHST